MERAMIPIGTNIFLEIKIDSINDKIIHISEAGMLMVRSVIISLESFR